MILISTAIRSTVEAGQKTDPIDSAHAPPAPVRRRVNQRPCWQILFRAILPTAFLPGSAPVNMAAGGAISYYPARPKVSNDVTGHRRLPLPQTPPGAKRCMAKKRTHAQRIHLHRRHPIQCAVCWRHSRVRNAYSFTKATGTKGRSGAGAQQRRGSLSLPKRASSWKTTRSGSCASFSVTASTNISAKFF